MENLLLWAMPIFTTFSAFSSSLETSQVAEIDTTLQIPEVSVTAIKQGQNLQSLAISSTTLGKKTIENLNIATVKDASEVVPNFYIPEYGSRITSSVYVRGIGARIDQPVVGLNVDNVPILNKDNYDFNLIDIARIEMLRGPQSTLYGRNTMGGLINIYTLSPMNYQGLRIFGEYGKGNTWQGALSYYTKIKDNLGLGIVGSYYSTDGFFKNLYNNKNCDWEHSGTGRMKLGWNPGEVKVENTLSFAISRQGGYPYQYAKTGEINYNDTCFYRRSTISDGLTVKWNWGDVDVSSISSYQYIDDNMTLDQDFLPKSYFTLTQAKKEHAATQDFIAKGKKGNYNWLAGTFGFYKRTKMSAPVTFLDDGIASLIEQHRNEANPQYPIYWDDRSFPLNSLFTNQSYGAALYHQSSYDLGKWNLSAGVRLDFEESKLDYNSNCDSKYTIYKVEDGKPAEVFQHKVMKIDENGSLKKNFLQFIPKVSATYSLKRHSNIFASIGKGYKAGGFNTQMFSDVLQQKVMNAMGIAFKYDIEDIISYKPEDSWNYEVGTHLEWMDKKLLMDMSLFYIHITNQQLTVFPEGTTTGRIMTNAGKSRSYGAEFAMKYMPLKELELSASYGYTNAKFTKFNNGKTDYAGKFIPYAPSNTLFLGANYMYALNKNWLRGITFDVNMRGVGKIYWDEANSVSQPFYAQLGASVTFANLHYSLQLWGKNLTNTDYNTFYFVSMGNAFLQKGKEATFGATLRINL